MTLHDLPESDWPRLWAWMQDAPDQNLDDDSPSSLDAFIAELHGRKARGERLFGAYLPSHDDPVGAIGCLIEAPAVCWLHGICLDPAYQRQGIGTAILKAMEAPAMTLMAAHYADNEPVRRLFARAGYASVGLVPNLVTRRGRAIDLEVVVKYVTLKESVCHSVAC